MSKCFKVLALILGCVSYGILFQVFYLQRNLPSQLYVLPGQSVYLENGRVEVEEVFSSIEVEKNVSLGEARLMGFFPIKSIVLKEIERPWLVPCGEPFGIKMLTQGAMVIGIGSVQTTSGNESPAKEGGLMLGDVILSYDGVEICSSNELHQLVASGEGKTAVVQVEREEKKIQLEVTPSLSNQGVYQLGLWVRDSSAGIGTLTYYNPTNQTFGGLGHGVCDVDTGELMPFQSGEVVEVFITDVQKGQNGIPGELIGEFHTSVQTGVLTDNRMSGVYGCLYKSPSQENALPIAFRQEIETGQAEILVTLEGTEPESYQIEIEKVNTGDNSSYRDMIIKITDEDLLLKTGGIVQGMSGSPILQNGKLVGAVTHVFVNDPTRGYGIFVENMLETMGETSPETMQEKLAG